MRDYPPDPIDVGVTSANFTQSIAKGCPPTVVWPGKVIWKNKE